MNTTYKFIAAGILASLLQFLMAQGPLVAQDQTVNDLERYEASINVMLRTFRDEEKQYISDVFDLIRDGTLPKELVDRSLQWVRKNRWYSNYRFIYFERVLRIHADNLEIALPDFDYSIYTIRR